MLIPQGDPRTYQIIGAAMEVHSTLHRGYLERIYCEALAVEFQVRKIPYTDQVPCQMEYKGHRVALLLNFGARWLFHKRFVLDPD